MKENQNRILLIEPPFYRLHKDTFSLTKYPLSLGYLAGTIKKETNWHVTCYNADFSPEMEVNKLGYMIETGFANYLHNLKDFSGKVWQEIQSVLTKYKPTVIGITAKTANFASAKIIAKLAKEFDKQIIVVVGGPHPSTIGSAVLDCPDIDICVKGEGEITIVELLKAIEGKKEFKDIKGIAYKENGQILDNLPQEFIKDLDSLCFPHESASEVLIDYDKYPPVAFNRIFATRGCPFNCSFCGSRNIWSRQVRFRSIENVIKQIKSIQEKIGMDAVHFDDDTFGVNKQYIQNLCNAFMENLPWLRWSCEAHVNLVDEQIISTMKRTGCTMIQLGIESGNNEILKKINKNTTIEKALSVCKIIKKHNIELQTFFMVGFPWETEETLKDTRVAMKKSKSDMIHYSIFTPYPGTEIFQFCKEKGLIGDDYDVSLYNHQSPKNSFCKYIAPERFRMLASEIEKLTDRINSLNELKRPFSFSTFRKIKELGLRKSLEKGMRIFRSVTGVK
jgi:radical SAM superfamily enzyme YgiQ (UPF0313 family)